MSIAIIRAGGKQFSVEKGATVRVPSLKHDVGASIELEVLAASGADNETRLGTPQVEGAKVMATVVDHGRAAKIIVFKKKRRKHYKRTQGHRQGYTTLKIDSIG
jgi:large subunit ribosomal protein L21